MRLKLLRVEVDCQAGLSRASVCLLCQLVNASRLNSNVNSKQPPLLVHQVFQTFENLRRLRDYFFG